MTASNYEHWPTTDNLCAAFCQNWFPQLPSIPKQNRPRQSCARHDRRSSGTHDPRDNCFDCSSRTFDQDELAGLSEAVVDTFISLHTSDQMSSDAALKAAIALG